MSEEQRRVWGPEAAATYDTPGEGMFAEEVLGPTVDRLVELADGGAALELAIGTGRVGVPLAERGVHVSGIELSPDMVGRLREKVDEHTLPVAVGDMSTTRVPGEFAVAYLVFNTISNLTTQEAQVACFRNAAAHLRPGGRFVIELWVPELRTLPPGRTATVGVAEPGYLLVDTYDVVRQLCVSHHVGFDPDILAEDARRASIGRGTFRYVWPAELDLMAQLAGMRLEHRWADWDRSPFTAESTSHVSVYRLADSGSAEGGG